MNSKRKMTRGLVFLIAFLVGTTFCFADTETADAVSKPDKVTGLESVSVSPTSIKIAWEEVDNATGYQISRDGIIVKKTSKISFTDKNLISGEKYSYKVRAYKKYKRTKWYNKKTKKWTYTKPKKKYRGKSKKVNAYKYGTYSAELKVKTEEESEQPGDDSDDDPDIDTPSDSEYPDPAFEVGKNVTFTYLNGVTFYLGQKFTSSLEAKLKKDTSGEEVLVRKDELLLYSNDWEKTKTCDETIYFFDVGDYTDFLAVYVCEGQIVRWATNRTVFGSEDGVEYKFGDTTYPEHHFNIFSNKLEDNSLACAIQKESETIYSTYGGALLAGFTGKTAGGFESLLLNSERTPNLTLEKRVGFHYTNAYRILIKGGIGAKVLVQEHIFEGEVYYTGSAQDYDEETGEWYDVYVENQRYGVDAHAESCSLSKYVFHDPSYLTVGPVAGTSHYLWNDIYDIIAQKNGMICLLENAGTDKGYSGFNEHGESILHVYETSADHMGTLLGIRNEWVCIGFSIADPKWPVHVERYGEYIH